MNQELQVYKYSPIKVIHFNLDKDEIEDYLSPRGRLMILKTNLIPKHLIYDMLDDVTECKVEIKYTFRVSDEEEKKSFGSYISEQFFYIKYVNDSFTKSQIENLFANSHFASEQKFEKLIMEKGLPKQLRFSSFTFPDYAVQELFQILKDKVVSSS